MIKKITHKLLEYFTTGDILIVGIVRVLFVGIALALGLSHSLVVSVQHDALLMELVFFVVAGIAQIVWALWFLKSKTKSVFYTGVLINGGLAGMWIMTRILPAPFSLVPEEVDFLGLVLVILEIVAIITSYIILLQSRKSVKGAEDRGIFIKRMKYFNWHFEWQKKVQ